MRTQACKSHAWSQNNVRGAESYDSLLFSASIGTFHILPPAENILNFTGFDNKTWQWNCCQYTNSYIAHGEFNLGSNRITHALIVSIHLMYCYLQVHVIVLNKKTIQMWWSRWKYSCKLDSPHNSSLRTINRRTDQNGAIAKKYICSHNTHDTILQLTHVHHPYHSVFQQKH
jgi:hypothetical protein